MEAVVLTVALDFLIVKKKKNTTKITSRARKQFYKKKQTKNARLTRFNQKSLPMLGNSPKTQSPQGKTYKEPQGITQRNTGGNTPAGG